MTLGKPKVVQCLQYRGKYTSEENRKPIAKENAVNTMSKRNLQKNKDKSTIQYI